MNDGGDFRTAPATPGLLNIGAIIGTVQKDADNHGKDNHNQDDKDKNDQGNSKQKYFLNIFGVILVLLSADFGRWNVLPYAVFFIYSLIIFNISFK